jgi:hypothetical protein
MCGLNDERSAPVDPHGRAALLLVESLIHDLVARSTLTIGEAIEIVETAVDADVQFTLEYGVPVAPLQNSTMLLRAISKTLRIDLPRE